MVFEQKRQPCRPAHVQSKASPAAPHAAIACVCSKIRSDDDDDDNDASLNSASYPLLNPSTCTSPPTHPPPHLHAFLPPQTSQDWASLPWDLSMPYEEAARVLGTWAGPSTASLQPGVILPLDQAAMTELLAETTLRGNKELEAALYAHADSVTRAIFGDDVYCGWRRARGSGALWRVVVCGGLEGPGRRACCLLALLRMSGPE